jgi:acetyl esterase
MKTFTCLAVLAVSMSFLSGAADAPKPNKQMQAVLDQLEKLGPKPLETLTPEEARKQPTPADAVKALLQSQGKSTAPEEVASVKNQTITGSGGEIPIRVYTPKGEGPFPVILYFHGGGWVIADLDTYDATPRALANAAQAVVVSSHYRQAPEHPFPASHDDALTAYKWVHANARSLSGDPARFAVVGESAGGNMAAAVCMMAARQNLALPAHKALIYPVAGTDMNTESYRQNADAKPLNKAAMEWFAKHEFKNPSDKQDPRIDLVHAKVSRRSPPCTIITAEIDPLRSEGEMLANHLKEAGVRVNYKNYNGVTHEFFGMGAVLDEARDAVRLVADDLKASFNSAQRQPVRQKVESGNE